MKDKQYYIELVERYFDADTSVAEERELREFLATTSDTDFDEVKMVMGFFVVAKTMTKPKTRVMSMSRWATVAAAVLLLIVAVPFFTSESSECMMIAEGETITNHAIVMEEMDKEMAMLFSTDEEESMESEMALILN